MQYRRAKTPGATYFFTVVTHQRQLLFNHPETINLLRQTFHNVKQRHPFTIDAIVVLPNHIHSIWTLPPEDANFSTRWRLIKSEFSRHCPEQYKQQSSVSRLSKGEQSIWQRRFWEHQIRDNLDFARHVDYIHYNPVRHGLVHTPQAWAYSSFHHYVRDGIYTEDWGEDGTVKFDGDIGKE